MVNIPMKTAAPFTRATIMSINQQRVQGAKSAGDIASLNSPASLHTNTVCQIPPLIHPVQKGQKVPLNLSGQMSVLKAYLGWNTTNSDCDVDVSAFMLNAGGKVIGDDWFVFYGQTTSPDHSTAFQLEHAGSDRESITIDLSKINPSVNKIVFVLTINEAAKRHLNFSMLRDAYIRIFDRSSDSEIVSFQMDEYYSNVTSMMIGEIYQYRGAWKFHAIGDGVARDLAGLCELYGVQVI